MRKFYAIFFVVLCSVLFTGQAFANDVSVKQGVLDLRNGKLHELKTFDLNGEWEFYWNQLLTPADLASENSPKKDFFIDIPSVWNTYELNGELLPKDGYATYRIKVLLDSPEKLAIKLGSIGTSFKAFADGEIIAEGGVIGTNKASTKPDYKTGIFDFTPKSSEFDIVIQVANYHYSKGGLWAANHKIGLEKDVRRLRISLIDITLLLLGSIFVMALYHLGLFILNRKQISTLYFALFCLTVFLRTLIVSEVYILHIMPSFNWFLLVRLEYLTLVGGILFSSLFVYSIFPDSYAKKALYVLIGLAVANGILVAAAPLWLFTKYLSITQLIILLGSLYMLFVIFKEIKKNNPSAKILTFGFSVMLLTVVNDIMFVNGILPTTLLSSHGFMFFIFSQAFMLSQRFSAMFIRTEELAGELKHINKNLETMVEERTWQITKQNNELKDAYDEIESKNVELEQQNDEIRATQERVAEQHRIVSKQKDEITDSIHYAKRIQHALLPNHKLFSAFAEHFVIYQPRDIVSGDFYWLEHVDNRVLFAVADCTGHSVPGAFMSMLGTAYLTEVVHRNDLPETSTILDEMRNKVKTALHQTGKRHDNKDGMNISLCSFDMQKMELQYSGAYHSLYIFRNGEIIKLKGDRQPIAVYRKEKPFTSQTMKLEKGDVIYTFTDGFVDQIGGSEKRKFMVKNLIELLDNVHKKPIVEQKQILEDTLNNWLLGNKQTDDILLTGIRI